MMATQIIYNGTVIGTVTAGQSKVLKCNGKKMKSDVEIRAGERTEIKYDGAVIATVEAGDSKTIKCAGKTMKSNIEIRVEDDTPGKDGVSPTVEMIDIEGGTRIIITDVNGPQSVDIMDGKDGKSAYQYAQEGGYSGTEEEFYAKLAEESGEFEEIDPTVPDWAKQPEKPKYTANEVGALPKDTKIPAKTSDISNDSGFITRTVGDLANYYLKSETLTKTEINALVSAIPKFAIQVVNSLPATDISTTTVYLLKSGIESDLYTEYIYVNGNWEILGSQRVDLTGYATENWVNIQLSAYLKSNELASAINTALAQAKASGEFDGKDGKDGVGIKSVVQTTTSSLDGGSNVITVTKTDDTTSTFTVKNGREGSDGKDGYTPIKGVDYYTEADKSEFSEYIASELAKRGQLAPEYAESLEWLDANGDQSKMYVLPDGMIWAYMLTEAESKPTYTNILPLAVNADGTPYVGANGEKGYKTDTRLNSSKVEKAEVGMCCTGFVPVESPYLVRLKNITPRPTSGTGGYCYLFASDRSTGTGSFGSIYETLENGYDAETGIYTLNLTEKATSGTAYFRLSIGNINENTIVTCNEEITESGGTVTAYAWASTGRAFVPADYEDRIIDLEKESAEHTMQIAALEKAVESGSTDETEAAALTRIKEWDKPIYDKAEVTLISEDRSKPALTASDRTISAIYAKYRALMAAHPRYITETNMGKCTASADFPAVDMLRFDFKEPDGLTDADYNTAKLHEAKPTIIFMSGIHTEWVGVWGLYYALEEITTNPAFDDIRRNAHIVVIPCANPFCLSKQTVEGWTTSHVNANGVAIHNNFGVNHSTSGSVGEYNYGGTAPYSELETQYIDAVMAEYPDAVAFVSCHNNDYSTVFGAPVIWASSATYHMCNVAFRLIDKISKAWLSKYGDALKTAVDEYKVNMDDGDYRLGRAMMSSSKGTEQLNATKYGIQGVNLEISRMMKVFSGNTDGSSEVMTHGAEVYANFMRTLLAAYDHKDKKEYAPNLPWSE